MVLVLFQSHSMSSSFPFSYFLLFYLCISPTSFAGKYRKRLEMLNNWCCIYLFESYVFHCFIYNVVSYFFSILLSVCKCCLTWFLLYVNIVFFSLECWPSSCILIKGCSSSAHLSLFLKKMDLKKQFWIQITSTYGLCYVFVVLVLLSQI